MRKDFAKKLLSGTNDKNWKTKNNLKNNKKKFVMSLDTSQYDF